MSLRNFITQPLLALNDNISQVQKIPFNENMQVLYTYKKASPIFQEGPKYFYAILNLLLAKVFLPSL